MSGLLSHEHYMRRVIELGKQNPRLPFGALIVDRVTGEILAEGWNRTEINPIWHGEIDAINRLAQARPTIDGTQLVLYTTAESCPMCQGAILWTGIETVVFGSSIRFLQSPSGRMSRWLPRKASTCGLNISWVAPSPGTNTRALPVPSSSWNRSVLLRRLVRLTLLYQRKPKG